MSGKKFCRLCLNEVFIASSNMYSNESKIREVLVNIFPGLNTVLTDTVRLCEECFNNVNFVTNVKEVFLTKEKEFIHTHCKGLLGRQYCSLCFRFETPFTGFLHKNNYQIHILREMIETALTENKYAKTDINVCGICWSWVKKIYSFKRHCFQIQEILKSYCLRNELLVLTDRDLEDFFREQYCIRTGRVFLDSIEDARTSNIMKHQTYFEYNGEVYSNLDGNVAAGKVEYDISVEEGILDQFKQNFDDQIDVPLIPHANLDIEEVTEAGNSKSDDTCATSTYNSMTFDADDEFDEELEKNNQNNVSIIILDDDDSDCEILEEASTNIVDNINKQVENDKVKSFQTDNIESVTNHKISEDRSKNNAHNVNKETEYYSIQTFEIDDCVSDENHNSCSKNSPCKCSSIENCLGESDKMRKQVIYCGTPQYSELDNKYATSCQIVERDISNSGQIVTNIIHLNVLQSTESEEDVSDKDTTALSSSFHFSNENASGSNDFDVFEFNDDEIRIEANEKQDLLLVDDDCFEVVQERDSIIDLTNEDPRIRKKHVLRSGLGDFSIIDSWGCYVCVARFSDKKSMRQHLLRHEDPWNKYGRFQCRHCPYRANWKGSVTKHEHYHSKGNQSKDNGTKLCYFCPYCDNTYAIKGDIQSHMNEHVISWKEFHCLDCMFTTNVSEALLSHYRNYHCIKKDPSFCPTSPN